MTLRETLTPVSFHLRHFNHYTTLDLQASANGNLTLVGENAAGKTTLANCFFPMLVDGSIATPSFNPAKGTDRLDKTSAPRNSARESRTFEGMLLGWGPGAMKVRTGYSYMVLRSQTRQVIVGIGAHRAVGETRKPTWWFVATSRDPQTALNLQTVDQDGVSLEYEAFTAANTQLGDDFKVFTQVRDFQDYVCKEVYGFSTVKQLGQLAAAYRLLASPILTAGNARFTPIREALKSAQESIDPQVIEFVASSQREVNRKNVMHQRLVRAAERLARLKKEIFWRNLNRLQELTLTPYGTTHQKTEKMIGQRETLQRQLVETQEQLTRVQPARERAEQLVDQLKAAQLRQKLIEEQRHDKQSRLTALQQRCAQYQLLHDQLADHQRSLATEQAAQAALVRQRQQLNQEHLMPLHAQLDAKTADLPRLLALMTQATVTPSQLASDLQGYLRELTKLETRYRNLVKNQQHVSDDIQIVEAVRETLDTRIDQRTQGPVVGRIRGGLHQDNLEVHEQGKSQMSTRYQHLEEQRKELLQDHPDLQALLKQASLSTWLTTTIQAFDKWAQAFADLKQQVTQQETAVHYAQQRVTDTQTTLDQNFPDFDVVTAQQQVNHLQAELDALVIDPQLTQKLVTAMAQQTEYRQQEQGFRGQVTTFTTQIQTLNQRITDLETQLQDLGQRTETALTALLPYDPADQSVQTIQDALTFVQQHGSEVRNHHFSDLTDHIGRLIHNNNENGMDPYALDTIFEERGHGEIASAMRQQRSIQTGDLRVVSFDINQAQAFITADVTAVEKSLTQLASGNEAAQRGYLMAAVHQITDQYRLVAGYNQILTHGTPDEQGIRLKVTLVPTEVDQAVINEALDATLEERPHLQAEIQQRLARLANDVQLANDDAAFMAEAQQLLDIRQWSTFKILIHRKQAAADTFEEVDDKFVQSGGSGAEKAQAMVLPLLLVPKMILHRSTVADAPHLVMFDEFADKLDPETAKSFAKTIAHFGFNFMATMPSGAQNKLLADGVANIAYDVIAPKQAADGKFHRNTVRPAMIWKKAEA